MEPGRGAPARCRATRQALNGWYHGPIHMSPTDVQEVTNGRFMRWPITPPTAVNARCGHACAQVPLQQSNYLTCLKLKKQPSTRIYHVTRREKTHDWFNFLWLISRREKKYQQRFSKWGKFSFCPKLLRVLDTMTSVFYTWKWSLTKHPVSRHTSSLRLLSGLSIYL